MLADPQSITVATVAQSLPAISREPNKSTYRSADEQYTLTVSHAYGKRRRRVVRVDHQKTASDPMTAQTAQVGASFQFIIDEPLFGYDDALLKDIALGLTGFLTSANLLKVAGGES